MTRLYINTSNSEKIIVKLNDLEIVEDARREKSQKLLYVIEKLLKKKKAKITDITRIVINPGPGSFTGLRVGMAVANTLGWALGIPVNSQDVKKKPVEPIYR